MNLENLKTMFSDEAFVKSLFALETADEVQAALKEKGVELTQEDIFAVRDMLRKVEAGQVSPEQLRQLEEGELSDDMLELVAGGGVGLAILIVAGVVAMAAMVTDLATESSW